MKHYVEVLICSVLLAALLVFCMVMWNDTHADEYLPLDSISPVIKPDLKPLECGLQRETPESAYMGMRLASNGMEFHFYDTNGDGIRDAILSIPQHDENRYPLFYSFDNTYNGEPDITWVDRLRDGTCGNVAVYWYRGQNKKEDSTRKEGEIVDCVINDCDKRKEGKL